MVSPVLVAIYVDTGDGYLVDHLVIDKSINIEAEKIKWEDWLKNIYTPEIQKWREEGEIGKHIEYMTFENWLIKNCNARVPTDDELVIISI